MNTRSKIVGATIFVTALLFLGMVMWERHRMHAEFDYEPVSYDYERIERK